MRRLLIPMAAFMGRLRRALSLADDPLPAEVLELVAVTRDLATVHEPTTASTRTSPPPTGEPMPDTRATQLPDLLGSVRRNPEGTVLAVLWPSPPHPAHWMVTDKWGSCGYETDAKVADWPVVGAVPFSPAAGMDLNTPVSAAKGAAA